jgi:osmotically-inducible protein OsmY
MILNRFRPAGWPIDRSIQARSFRTLGQLQSAIVLARAVQRIRGIRGRLPGGPRDQVLLPGFMLGLASGALMRNPAQLLIAGLETLSLTRAQRLFPGAFQNEGGISAALPTFLMSNGGTPLRSPALLLLAGIEAISLIRDRQMRPPPRRTFLGVEQPFILGPAVVAAIATGAALMFILDPQTGRRRREVARDRAGVAAQNAGAAAQSAGGAIGTAAQSAGSAIGTAAQKAATGAKGVSQKAIQLIPIQTLGFNTNGSALVRQVERAVYDDPEVSKGQLSLDAHDGVVFLRGEVERPEQIDSIEQTVRGVPGVRDVENLLHLPETPETPEYNSGDPG